MNRPMLEADKFYCFRRATESMSGASERWKERALQPISDKHLVEALSYELGELGGGCGPNEPEFWYRRNGLKIWGAWSSSFLPKTEAPLWAGAATVAMARQVYGIKTPEEFREPTLFDFAQEQHYKACA